jgi:hypothetical protein
MVYNTQNYWVSGSGILNTRKHNIPEIGYVAYVSLDPAIEVSSF